MIDEHDLMESSGKFRDIRQLERDYLLILLLLCSPDSSYITGTNIQIDGGIINYPF